LPFFLVLISPRLAFVPIPFTLLPPPFLCNTCRFRSSQSHILSSRASGRRTEHLQACCHATIRQW
jgi:hypothetical protein